MLEAGGNWISAWLDRLDHRYEVSVVGLPRADRDKVLGDNAIRFFGLD